MKILKEDGYEKKLESALKYYENEEYFKASTLLKDIKPLVKGSEESETVLISILHTLYITNNMILVQSTSKDLWNYFPEVKK